MVVGRTDTAERLHALRSVPVYANLRGRRATPRDPTGPLFRGALRRAIRTRRSGRRTDEGCVVIQWSPRRAFLHPPGPGEPRPCPGSVET
jgi:hypothetical protein